MAKNEKEFRDQVAELLQNGGFSVRKEYKLPEQMRVDILAVKENQKYGIEVKLNQRGIADDIVKGWKLLRMPEFDFVYVVAPDVLLCEENISHARGLGVGIIAVTGDSLNWRQESIQLEPAKLGAGGAGYNHTDVHPNKVFDIYYHASNTGQKAARNLVMYFAPGGPFIKAPNGSIRYRRSRLGPGEDWKETFKIKVRSSTKPGIYPLYLCCRAEGIGDAALTIDVPVTT